MHPEQQLTIEQLCNVDIVRSPETDPHLLLRSASQALRERAEQDETRVRLLLALAWGHKRLGDHATAARNTRKAFELAGELNILHLIGYAELAHVVQLASGPATNESETYDAMRASLQALASDPNVPNDMRVQALDQLNELTTKRALFGKTE